MQVKAEVYTHNLSICSNPLSLGTKTIVGLEEGPGVAEDVNKADEERRRREKARSLSSPSVTTPQPLEAGDNSNSNLFLGNLTAKLNCPGVRRPGLLNLP